MLSSASLARALLAPAALAALVLTLVAPGAAAEGPQDDAGGERPDLDALARSAAAWESPRDDAGRAEVPEDRYAPAGGCYRLVSVAAGAPLVRAADGYTTGTGADAEPFRLRATDLGRYLLYDRDERFLAAEEGLVGEALDEATDNSAAAMADGLARGSVDPALDEVAAGEAGEASGRGGAVVAAAEPSELADVALTEDGDAFRLTLPAIDAALAVDDAGEPTLVDAASPGPAGRWRLRLEEGCADWPEPELNVAGPAVGGDTPYEQVRGYLDAHLHLMASEFLGGRARCGQPWHPYGVTHALQGCDEHEDSGGRTHILETAVSGGVDPVRGHDTTGWPTFADWPRHDLLTYEQVHHRWLQRAHRGGLRMAVALLVDNAVLCQVYPFKENSCNEMDGVRLQARRIHELERFIDAQHGGPGQGWLRVVDDPFEARRAMNDGQLAVVLGMEVSRPFDCRLLLGVPQCSAEELDRDLAALHDLGVRQLEVVNKFDNALTGVAGDAGETGVVVNTGNVIETGQFWQMEPCEEQDHDHGHGDRHDTHDKRQMNLHDEAGTPDEATGRDSLVGGILEVTGSSGAAPVYPAGPHCNARGLSDLGEHLLDRIMERGLLFDPDHMSAKARHQALSVIEEADYPGVVSSHSWADDVVYRRVYDRGGVVTPMAGSSTGFAATWEQHRAWARDERFSFGFGFGSDVNGFASQGAPRFPDADPGALPEDAVFYPFEGFGGVEIDRQVSGERVFDVNTDGVAHYGLYPDWIEDLRQLAGDAIVEDLERGPERYLAMWERAVGVAPDACRPDVGPLGSERLDELEAGMSPEEVLVTLGRPNQRIDDEFTYCVEDGTAVLGFDADGRLARIDDEGPGGPGGPPDDRPGDGPPQDPPGRASGNGPSGAHDHDAHDHGAGESPALAAASPGEGGVPLAAPALLAAGLVGLLLHALGRRRAA